jgi:2-succinyl-5-enolpyruvyl-6-hydroxy-3-cyclohexene-1-carboxylate synthase
MNESSLTNARATQAWGTTLARTLSAIGVRHVVFSPGSRSTPLILACEACKGLETLPILDERSAGFYAIGLAKKSKKPVAVICTSGTAPANLLPAAVEANMSGTPLLLLTADRPPELRDCQAGQSIDQTKLFGTQVRWFHELSLPRFHLDALSYLRQTIVQAVGTATGSNPGPVHLNFPFREPFFVEEEWANPKMPEDFAWDHFLQQVSRPVATRTLLAENLSTLRPFRRWLVLAGQTCFRNSATAIADKLGAPLLPEAFSPIRETTCQKCVLHFENLLRDEAFRANATPDAVLSLGPLPTSKTLRSWLNELDSPTWVVEPSGRNVDALHRRTVHLACDFEELAESLPKVEADDGWLESWTKAETRVEAKLSEAFSQIENLFEGKVAHLLSNALPDDSDLVVANSMPVRDVEWFWQAGKEKRRLWGNRGANGIDGTLSTALGVAHASENPAFFLTGDLAFLHDINGLLSKHIFHGSLTVIIINNRGGGIFENLPVAKLVLFEKCFATPQEVDFGKLCEAHGIPHAKPVDWTTFEDLIREPLEQGIRVIEVVTDRKSDVETRQNLLSLGPST